MLIQLDALKNLPVASLEDEARIGRIDEVLLHPDTGELVGFWVQPDGWLTPRRALSSRDIVSYDTQALVVRSADTLVHPTEIQPFQLVSRRADSWLGKHVATQSGTRLGRVHNIVLNTDLELLAKLYVKSSLPFGFGNERVIARSEIVRVSPKLITIKGDGTQGAAIHSPLSQRVAA